MSRLVPELLNALLAEGRFSAEDLGGAAGCSANMVYKVRNEDAELSTSKVQALALYLCRHGDTRLAECFVSPDFVVVKREGARANGRIDDELGDMTEVLADLRRAHQEGDRDAFERAHGRGLAVMENAAAEGRLLTP